MYHPWALKISDDRERLVDAVRVRLSGGEVQLKMEVATGSKNDDAMDIDE